MRMCRQAFTLIEVVVALAIGGMAVASAAAMLRAVTDHTESVIRGAAQLDQSANHERMLRRMIGQIATPRPDEPAPLGVQDSVRFVSWCERPEGWAERCSVELTIGGPYESPILWMRANGASQPLQLLRPPVAFLYLSGGDGGGYWTARWIDVSSTPAAIGVVLGADTVIFATGRQ